MNEIKHLEEKMDDMQIQLQSINAKLELILSQIPTEGFKDPDVAIANFVEDMSSLVDSCAHTLEW